MNSLATRIADVKKKAEAAPQGPYEAQDGHLVRYQIVSGLQCCGQGTPSGECCGNPVEAQDHEVELLATGNDALLTYIAAASPSLFIEMADEIDRLTAQLEKAKEALEPFHQLNTKLVATVSDEAYVGGGVTYGHLRAAARFYEETATSTATPAPSASSSDPPSGSPGKA